MFLNFVEFYLFPDQVKYDTSYLGAKYNQANKSFSWDDGAQTNYDNYKFNKYPDSDQCLAIVPTKAREVDVWTKYWQDVKCDIPKTYFVCAYTNGNLQFKESLF